MSTVTSEALSYEDSQELIQQDAKLQEAVERVKEIDFSMLKRKLVEEDGWTNEFCNEVEDLYRKFLALNVRYPDQKICPTGPVDEFWHAHIVDTIAYEKDCNELFGSYFHHFPYFGMRGKEDRLDLETTFNESLELFISHFGVDPTGGDVEARSCAPQRCP